MILIRDDNCTSCKLEQKTIEHAAFECPIPESPQKDYNLNIWKDIWNVRNFMSIHFATNLLTRAWKIEGEKTIDYLNKTNSRWSRANANVG